MKIVLIIWIIYNFGQDQHFREYPMPDWETCWKSVETSDVRALPGTIFSIVTCIAKPDLEV